MSTCAAEFVVLGNGGQKLEYIINLLDNINFPSVINIKCNNQVAIIIATDKTSQKKTKYLRQDFFFINDMICQWKINLHTVGFDKRTNWQHHDQSIRTAREEDVADGRGRRRRRRKKKIGRCNIPAEEEEEEVGELCFQTIEIKSFTTLPTCPKGADRGIPVKTPPRNRGPLPYWLGEQKRFPARIPRRGIYGESPKLRPKEAFRERKPTDLTTHLSPLLRPIEVIGRMYDNTTRWTGLVGLSAAMINTSDEKFWKRTTEVRTEGGRESGRVGLGLGLGGKCKDTG
ncbi:hypothetical protein BY996DRAFT_6444456 [Phakopsora pachyrhizi]|nr:hypothetical protein BY996DRAFT_6444456 [Phakopsora pachyrhizi]